MKIKLASIVILIFVMFLVKISIADNLLKSSPTSRSTASLEVR